MKKLLLCSILFSTACLETLDGYEYEDVRMGLDDCHPNDKGHSLISKKLYQYYEARYGTIF